MTDEEKQAGLAEVALLDDPNLLLKLRERLEHDTNSTDVWIAAFIKCEKMRHPGAVQDGSFLCKSTDR